MVENAEQLKAYLLWIKERGIEWPVEAKDSHQNLGHTPQKSQTSKIKILFLMDKLPSGKEGQRLPLVGDEAILFERMICAMHLEPKDYQILAAFPSGFQWNTEPNHDDLDRSTMSLIDAIHKLNPGMIVSMGQQATQRILGKKRFHLSDMGQVTLSELLPGISILPTLHPRDLLRFPANKRLSWEHLKQSMLFLGLDKSHYQ